jgi:hypothetical protein
MSEITFHFLNVGKGNCTIIDFPSERLSVIDIDDSRAISTYERTLMEKAGKAKLTNPIGYIASEFANGEIFRFILTHPDMDHISGIKRLFEEKYVRNFWDTKNDKHIDPATWENSPYDKEEASNGINYNEEKKQIEKLKAKAEKIEKWLSENEGKQGKRGKEIQSNITDNQSAKMKTSHGVIQGYHGQALVDSKHQVIVYAEAFGNGQDEEGREIYSERMKIVEPVFANLRIQKGMDYLTLRGKVKVNIQWLLYCIVHNIGKIGGYGMGYG